MTLLAQERLLKPLLMAAALLGIANDAIAQNFVMTEISDDIHLVKGLPAIPWWRLTLTV